MPGRILCSLCILPVAYPSLILPAGIYRRVCLSCPTATCVCKSEELMHARLILLKHRDGDSCRGYGLTRRRRQTQAIKISLTCAALSHTRQRNGTACRRKHRLVNKSRRTTIATALQTCSDTISRPFLILPPFLAVCLTLASTDRRTTVFQIPSQEFLAALHPVKDKAVWHCVICDRPAFVSSRDNMGSVCFKGNTHKARCSDSWSDHMPRRVVTQREKPSYPQRHRYEAAIPNRRHCLVNPMPTSRQNGPVPRPSGSHDRPAMPPGAHRSTDEPCEAGFVHPLFYQRGAVGEQMEERHRSELESDSSWSYFSYVVGTAGLTETGLHHSTVSHIDVTETCIPAAGESAGGG